MIPEMFLIKASSNLPAQVVLGSSPGKNYHFRKKLILQPVPQNFMKKNFTWMRSMSILALSSGERDAALSAGLFERLVIVVVVG